MFRFALGMIALAQFAQAVDRRVLLHVELYYRASVPSPRTNVVVFDKAVTVGENLYLEDPAHEHPNLPHYNFRVVKITDEAVTLEQIADRRGAVQQFYSPQGWSNRQILAPGKALEITRASRWMEPRIVLSVKT